MASVVGLGSACVPVPAVDSVIRNVLVFLVPDPPLHQVHLEHVAGTPLAQVSNTFQRMVPHKDYLDQLGADRLPAYAVARDVVQEALLLHRAKGDPRTGSRGGAPR